MRVPFSSVFKVNPDGSITPEGQIQIGGVVMSPGVTFQKGVSFSGIDIANYIGKDLEVEDKNGIKVITTIYSESLS